MHTRVLKPKHAPTILVRPLRHGDVRTVMSLFERLGERSRRTRFNGPKPCLSVPELRQLASVDPTHHVLVAYVESDPQAVAIARLVRAGRRLASRVTRLPTTIATTIVGVSTVMPLLGQSRLRRRA